MNPKTNYIAKIISKILSADLSEKEEKILQDWLLEDPKHEDILKRILNAERLQSDLNLLKEFDAAKNWEKINHEKKKPFTFKGVLIKFAIAACSIIFLYFLQYFLGEKHSSDHRSLAFHIHEHFQKKEPKIYAAQEGAVLRMFDGQKIDLKKPIDILSEGQIINERKHKLAQLPSSNKLFYNFISVPKAQYYSFQFADGTKVWLNSNTNIRFPSRFARNERKVLLHGEAYFEVSPDRDRPFIITTERGTIRVLGTKFNVRTYGEQMVSSLLEGSIQLESDAIIHLLQPAQKGIIGKNGFQIQSANFKKDLAWKNQLFYFQNDKLKYILEELENWYGIQVDGWEKLGDQDTYSGEISRKVTLQEILSLISYTSDLEFNLVGQNLIINRK